MHLILLKPQTKSASPRAAAPIDIVEIGTESGHCFKDLFERANDTGTPSSHIHFYGIDPSVPMLKRVMAWFDRQPALKIMAPIEWVEGVSEGFPDKLPQLKGVRDLVMWTDGGFSHLCSEE